MKDIPDVFSVRLLNSVDGPLGQATTINAVQGCKLAVLGDAIICDSQKGTRIIPLANVAFIVPMTAAQIADREKQHAAKGGAKVEAKK